MRNGDAIAVRIAGRQSVPRGTSRRRSLGRLLLLMPVCVLLLAAPAHAVRITEYSDGLGARGLVVGPDGKLWGTRIVDDEGKNLRTDYMRVDPAGPTLLSSFAHPGTLSNDIVRAGSRVYAADRPETSAAVIAEVGPRGLNRLTQPGTLPMQAGFAGGPDGKLWLGRTFNYLNPAAKQVLLSRFDPATRAFSDLPLEHHGGFEGAGSAIAVAGDGTVWFDEQLGLRPRGNGRSDQPRRINRLNPATGQRTAVELPGTTAPSGGVVARDGSFWFVGSHGLIDDGRRWLVGRVSPDGKSVQLRFPPFEVGFLLAITVGPDGALWAPSKTGLVRIDPATFAMQEIVYPTSEEGGLQARIVTIGDELWTGSEQNLVRVEPDKNGVATGDLVGAQRGGVTAPVACTTACNVTAEVLARPRARVASAARRRPVRLGRRKLSATAGYRNTLIVRLARSRRVKRYLRRHRSLSVRVRVRVREGGRTTTAQRRIVLRKRGLKKPRRRR